MGQFGPIGKGATWTSLGKLAHAPQTLGLRPKGVGEGRRLHLGLRPTFLVEGQSPSPLLLYKGSPSTPSSIPIHSLLLSSPLLSLALAPIVWSWLGRLEVLPPCERRRAVGFLARVFLLPLPLVDRSPEDVYTPYVCRTTEVLHLSSSSW